MFRLLRKRKRVVSTAFLLVFLADAFTPTISFALSGGAEQAEYTSFESPGASDMVNLLTGDFSYNINLLDVPGPEGSFSVPLFYHAGITAEQDASWAGLGWNINVGSISRSVVGNPDDAYDDQMTVTMTDPGASGWAKNFIFYKRTWDSEKGYGGSISLFDIVGVEWSSTGMSAATVMGVNFDKGGINGSWTETAMGIASAVGSIASFGAASGAIAVAKQAAISVAFEVAVTAAIGAINEGTINTKFQDWQVSNESSCLGFKTEYKYWLDDERTEFGFGALYLGSTDKSSLASSTNFAAPDYNTASPPKVSQYYPRIAKVPFITKPAKGFIHTDNGLVTSDMYLNVQPGDNYSDVVRPSHISYDQFSVMTAGASGAIAPYRLEVGSLSQPKRYAKHSMSYNVIPFVEEDNAANKVQFHYQGYFANKYLHHDDPTFGVTHSTFTGSSANTYDEDKKYLMFEIDNNKLVEGGNRIEQDASRIKDKKVVTGKNVEWFSNQEILSGSAKLKGFIDNTNSGFSRTSAPDEGIGGFMITKEDGTTYHYAQPVYRTYEEEFVGNKDEPSTKYSKSVNNNKVATTWLLTSITGPDYIDRGTIGKVDDADWGYWVAFDYGRSSQFYHYRNPYYGYFEDETSSSYSTGKREQYYINYVRTRTHTAMFIKGVRTDGLSAYTDTAPPAQQMCLSEIALMTNDDYASLHSLGFTRNSGSTIQGGSLTNVFDVGDVNASSTFSDFIKNKSLRRIKMVFETDETLKLCNKSVNSFTDISDPIVPNRDFYLYKQGKLTLKRVQFIGRNDVKIFPDYKFEYGYNPDYNMYHYDAWGYYTPNGTSSLYSHKPSSSDQHASAWSLTNIVLPTGGSIDVSYARDTYASIAGEAVYADGVSVGIDPYTTTSSNNLRVRVTSPSSYQVGERVKMKATLNYTCNGVTASANLTGLFYIRQVDATYIYVDILPWPCDDATTVNVNSLSGKIYKINKSKKGGDIRVSMLTYTDEFGNTDKTKYSYTKSDNVTSSGVVSKEPFIVRNEANENNHGIDQIYDFPQTGVMYSRVSVQSGYNRLSDDFSIRHVYDFITPAKDMVRENSIGLFNNSLGFGLDTYIRKPFDHGYYTAAAYLKMYQHEIDVKTAGIGKVDKISVYDKNNTLVSTQDFIYNTNPASDQGKYTQGVLLAEGTGTSSSVLDPFVFKLIRTTKTFYPHVLTGITHTRDGFTDTKTYKAWDFFTGGPLVTETKTASNFITREEKIPAYAVSYVSGSSTIKPYASMGLKGFNIANKNMVGQEAGTYLYRLNSTGEITGLIGANIQTWKNDWQYRVYSAGSYIDQAEGAAVWRKHADYSFIGNHAHLTGEGFLSFATGDKFNFNPSAVNSMWRRVGATEKYDHYSLPLQYTDFTNTSTATKMDFTNAYKLAEASNAMYHEMAYSGAEDLNAASGFFGGEVKKGNGSVSSTTAHTGKSSLQLNSGTGFVYTANDLPAGRAYRAKVWTTSTIGRLYYKIGGVQTVSSAPLATMKIGSWYLVELEVPAQGAVFDLEIGVKNASLGDVYFDDFRFQPVDASLSAYVYDPATKEVQFVLGDDNLFTKYEYDESGALERVYQESFSFGVKKVSEYKKDYRRFHIDQ